MKAFWTITGTFYIVCASVVNTVNRGRFAHDAKFISIQAGAMDGVFFGGFRLLARDVTAIERDRLNNRGDFDTGIDAKATPKFHSFPSDERDFLEIWVTRREDCRR